MVNALKNIWADVEAEFLKSSPVLRLWQKDVGIEHYAAYLRETYFYTREDPQIQAAATAWFRGADREMVRPFLQHALSEVGHDGLALHDLSRLGYSTEGIQSENPLPTTMALISFPFYAIQYRTPLAYLGYLYFLEFLPTGQGQRIAASIRELGVPETAMTFLSEHRDVDTHHNRLMDVYADHMLRRDDDILEVEFAMRTTATNFAAMLDGAFRSVDKGALSLRRSLQSA